MTVQPRAVRSTTQRRADRRRARLAREQAAAIDPREVNWVIYARLSRKKPGKRRNDQETVQGQIRICRDFAEARGLNVARVYVDNHRTGWDEDGIRPDWNAMMEAAERGEFGGILLYKIDRYARNGPAGEDLIRINQEHAILVDGPLSGSINLTTAEGKRQFRNAMAAGAFESDNISERAHDGIKRRAERGLLLGAGRLWGYEILSQHREYEDDVEPIRRPAEVELIREAARRRLAGEVWSAIAADLNERGFTTVQGNPWTGSNLAHIMSSPRYGGIVLYDGVEVARLADPILDADTYGRLQVLLSQRRRGPQSSGRFPLTKSLWCGNAKCQRKSTLAGGRGSYRESGSEELVRTYNCAVSSGGCGMTIRAERVEEIVRARILADMAVVASHQEYAAEQEAAATARGALDAQERDILNGLADMEIGLRTGRIEQYAYDKTKEVLDRQLSIVRAKVTALATAEQPRRVAVAGLTAEKLKQATPGMMAAFLRDLRLKVTVYPPSKGPRKVFQPERVSITER
jgi:DNA invertase Pin-like site-specific DNA recombinase